MWVEVSNLISTLSRDDLLIAFFLSLSHSLSLSRLIKISLFFPLTLSLVSCHFEAAAATLVGEHNFSRLSLSDTPPILPLPTYFLLLLLRLFQRQMQYISVFFLLPFL